MKQIYIKIRSLSNFVFIFIIARYKIFPSGNLQISNVKSTDSGVYTCSARNPVTNEIRNNTKRTILKVYGKLLL